MSSMAPKKNKTATEDANEKKRGAESPLTSSAKVVNNGPTPPGKSGLQASSMATQETNNSTPNPNDPNSRSPRVPSPNSSPKTRLNIENDDEGAGWATENDTRPKPVRPRFNDLKNIECQVTSGILAKLNELSSEDLSRGGCASPKVRSEEDHIRSIANRIISRPGEIILVTSEILKQAMIENLIKKDLMDKFVLSDLTSFFGETSLSLLIQGKVKDIARLLTQAAEVAASNDPALRDAMHASSQSLAHTFLKKVALLLKENAHNGHFNDFCNKLNQIEGPKLQNVILESHINNMNFVPTIILALEDLPSGSATNSLQTIDENVSALTIANEELTVRVKHGEVKLANTMDVIADIKSEEVATRHTANEHKVRLHNVKSIHNFNDTQNYKAKVDLVVDTCSKIAGHNSFELDLITPRSTGRHFESLAIVTFPTPRHKYKFEKSLSDYKKSNSSCNLTSSRPKMEGNRSDTFQSDNDMRAQIKAFYDTKLASTDNPHRDHAPLTEHQVKGIQINLKQLKGPNRSYFEFLDPSNGTFFLVYNKTSNPFYDHDFTKPIPNRSVRKLANDKKEYLLKFKPKVWKNSTR